MYLHIICLFKQAYHFKWRILDNIIIYLFPGEGVRSTDSWWISSGVCFLPHRNCKMHLSLDFRESKQFIISFHVPFFFFPIRNHKKVFPNKDQGMKDESVWNHPNLSSRINNAQSNYLRNYVKHINRVCYITYNHHSLSVFLSSEFPCTSRTLAAPSGRTCQEFCKREIFLSDPRKGVDLTSKRFQADADQCDNKDLLFAQWS